ncbi:mRNA cleavage and polyadenylation specificity factor complex subunit [Purpureocillium lilacinum]|uniref:mRNA cleavage and polyadenylation specificity factor complex subunit n=1 Tax=Purpureocillium lilacinum TaxID=33203 RepID=A0A179HMW8_PURLI|nr:mRNA cleavage and polyadenylation specificity factor complex subunit [Purpureocillium lilacinum]OAQ91018.1 mRNA cleavage and polyadenylation specificity factor complex subunit [Purpureocillium lilacinum]
MATATTLSVPDQIRQLDDARKLVLGDVKYYPSVVRGIIPIIGPSAPVELRRWGADFLAEAFSTPALPNGEKETMQPYVLTTLESLLESDRQDWLVLRSVIQAAASIYPLAMRWIINNGYDTVTWERMVVIKQRILRIWDTAPPSVRISCIKFAQRVVLAQTVASNAEFRYGGALDVSLDKVPLNHQSLDPRNLEAEATGLLDRMLSVLQESSDALIVDATLNCLSILVRTRPATSGRILNALLNFNPLQAATSPMTPKNKVMVKSMEKTARMLLLHLTKRDPHNPMAPRIQQHLERMVRSVTELFDETSKTRPLEAPQHDGLDAKRQRVVGSHAPIPPLGPGPHSLGDVFTLITNDELKGFDISQLPVGLVAKVSVTALARLEPELLSKAVDAVRRRLHDLATAPAPELNPNTAPLGVDDDDDDYEPDFYQAEDTEQILNKLDGASSATEPMALDGSLALTSFSLPQPPSLPAETALSAGSGTVARVLEMMKSLDEPAVKKDKAGYNRLAASSGTRDSWMSILSRLATRASAGLEDVSVKGEDDDTKRPEGLSDDIRELLYNYVMEDFRKHIDVAVSWLCEEWYNDKTQMKRGDDHLARYEKCTLRLIDGFLPYLHPQDKVLTRFLSEIPELNPTMLSRIKHMCRDPSVTQLALTSLLYLVIMRPPVKESALDTVQDIWTEFEDARPMAGKYLAKYRPGFLEAANNSKAEGDGAAPAAIAT